MGKVTNLRTLWGVGYFLLGMGLFGGSRSAHAFALTPVVGAAQGKATINSTAGYTVGPHSFVYGGGLLFEFKFTRIIAFELGTLYMPRGFVMNTNPAVEVTFTTLQLPFLMKLYFLPSIAVGIGAYYTRGINSISNSSATGSTTTTNYDSFTYSPTDYGAVFSLSLKLAFMGAGAIIVDGRALYGLPNISQQAGISNTLSDYQILVGLRFGR